MAAPAAAVIFVEGAADALFMRHYLGRLGFDDSRLCDDWKSPDRADKIVIYEMGSVNRLESKKPLPELLQIGAASRKVLFVVDANDNPQKRRDNAEAAAKETGAETDVFLLPDNKSAGMLEHLLEDISVERGFYECFGKYEECLRDKGFKEPKIKGKIYAYCEAQGMKSPGKCRDYGNAKHWNLNHSALEPLKKFLLQNLPPPADKRA